MSTIPPSIAPKVWILRLVVEEIEKYAGFHLVDNSSVLGQGSLLDDFKPVNRPGDSWFIPHLTPVWRPPRVAGAVSQNNDFPCIALHVPVFSERAVKALQDLLLSNGELLAVNSDRGRYWIFNTTRIVNALDRTCSRRRGSSVIDRYCFHDSQLCTSAIFKIPEDRFNLFVTKAFYDRVAEHALQGLDLIPVWPLPDGETWRQVERRTRSERRRQWEARLKLNVNSGGLGHTHE